MELTKFNVVNTNTELQSKVLATFDKYEDAISFMNTYVDRKHVKEGTQYTKIYHLNKNTIAVYESGYLWGKTEICKYQILEYKDWNQGYYEEYEEYDVAHLNPPEYPPPTPPNTDKE